MDRLLDKIVCGNIECGVATRIEDIEAAEKLRYDMLVLDFNSDNINTFGTDKSDYDDICDHLVAIDTDTDKVVGTYRVLSDKSDKYQGQFVSDHEFDLSNLKGQSDGIVELSRAVVHTDYRNGSVIKALWQALFSYCNKRRIRYLFGTASYHGVDPSIYANSFAWLKDKYLVDSALNCTPCDPNAKFTACKYDICQAKEETPSLIKGYLSLGCKVADGAYIDRVFGSIDVLTILDLSNVSRVFERIIK